MDNRNPIIEHYDFEVKEPDDSILKDLHRTPFKLNFEKRISLGKLLKFFLMEHTEFIYAQPIVYIAAFLVNIDNMTLGEAYKGFCMILGLKDVEYQIYPNESTNDLESVLYLLKEKHSYYRRIFEANDVSLPYSGNSLFRTFLIDCIPEELYSLVIYFATIKNAQSDFRSTFSTKVIFAAVIVLFDIAFGEHINIKQGTLTDFLKFFQNIDPIKFKAGFFSINKKLIDDVIEIRKQFTKIDDENRNEHNFLFQKDVAELKYQFKENDDQNDKFIPKSMQENISPDGDTTTFENSIPLEVLYRGIQKNIQNSYQQNNDYDLTSEIMNTTIDTSRILKQWNSELRMEVESEIYKYHSRTPFPLNISQRKDLVKLLKVFYIQNRKYDFFPASIYIAAFFINLGDITIDEAYNGFQMIIKSRSHEYQNSSNEVSLDMRSMFAFIESKNTDYKIYTESQSHHTSGIDLFEYYLIGIVPRHSYTLVIYHILCEIIHSNVEVKKVLKKPYKVPFAAIITLFNIAIEKRIKIDSGNLENFFNFIKKMDKTEFQNHLYSIEEKYIDEVVSIREQMSTSSSQSYIYQPDLAELAINLEEPDFVIKNPLRENREMIPLKKLEEEIVSIIKGNIVDYPMNENSAFPNLFAYIPINEAAIEYNYRKEKYKLISIFLFVIGYLLVSVIDIMNFMPSNLIGSTKLYQYMAYLLLPFGVLIQFVGFFMAVYIYFPVSSWNEFNVYYY